METTRKPKKRFGPVKRSRSKGVSLSDVELVRTRFLGEEPGLPAVVEPGMPNVDLIDWAGAQRIEIERLLHAHGGVLFRGFGIGSVADFQSFCAAVCPQLYGEYGDLPTEKHSEKIYGATPYPPDKVILFHNESSHTHRWPMRQFFHCVKVARRGGETPLVDGREVWRRLDPEVGETFRRKGLLYVRNFVEGFDVSWRQFFRTTDKHEVKRRCREAGIELDWFGDELRTRQWAPAVADHPVTGETVFFNQIQLHHVSCLEPEVRSSVESLYEEGRWPRNVYYGDGTPIPDALVREICDLYWQLAVRNPWQEGDVIALDNMLVSHARSTYEGERKLVVAMGEMMSQARLREEGKCHWTTPAGDAGN